MKATRTITYGSLAALCGVGGLSAPAIAALSLGGQDRDPYLAVNRQLVAHGCQLCHAADYARVGPAMTDVAAFYAGQGNAAASLKASIGNGAKGKWGTAIMPAQHQVRSADLDRLVGTILALQKAPAK